MRLEQDYFIHLLRDYVHQKPSWLPVETLDWDKLLRIAGEQALCGIIYYQTRSLEGIPKHTARKGAVALSS